MSKAEEVLRVGIIAEGKTDYVVICCAIDAMLGGEDYTPTLLQPEYSDGLEATAGQTGEGWSGVYQWCRQAANEGQGRVSSSIVFNSHDIVVIHLDADVAAKSYSSANLRDASTDLPCKRPCPPAKDTTDALRKVLMRWMGEKAVPPRCVICMPSKSTGTWVLASLFPKNNVMAQMGWECYDKPDKQLAAVPMNQRVKKTPHDYESHRDEFVKAWSRVKGKLSEAQRFAEDFRLSLP